MSESILPNETLPVNVESASPSGISHAFDTGYAIAYGVDEAIMIRNLQFFITANANRGQNFHEGKYWTYDRLEDFPKHFPYWTIKQIRRIIASLIEQEVIIKGEFNDKWSDRTQWYAFKDQDKFIKNTKPPKERKPTLADLPNRAFDSLPDGNLTDAQSGNCIIDTTTISSAISSSSSLKVPNEPMAAKAADVSENKSSKSKREKPDFSPKVREVANQLLNLLLKNCPVYRPPSDLTKFLTHVQDLIEKDKQDPDLVIKTFEWAVSDNEKRGDFSGWQGIIASNTKGGRSTTPVEIFRKHFAKIHSQMRARPKRKFAASSDQNAAMEAMEEMNKRAL